MTAQGYDASSAQQQITAEWELMQGFDQGVQQLQQASQSGDVQGGGGGVATILEAVGGILGGGAYSPDQSCASMLQDWQTVAREGKATTSAENDLSYLYNSAKNLYDGWYAYLNAQGYAGRPQPIYYNESEAQKANDFIGVCTSTLGSLL